MTKTKRDMPKALPLQARALEAVKIDAGRDERTLSLSASSETPVDRGLWVEVLDHRAEAVNLERLEGGAVPLLFNHDWSDPIGMVSGGRLVKGRLEVEAQLFETQRADDVRAWIKGGLRNISIGYSIDEMREREREGDFLVTRWTPHEVSVVTVPADPSVGINRDLSSVDYPVRITRAKTQPAHPAEVQEVHMDNPKTAPAAGKADKIEITSEAATFDPLLADKKRTEGIRKIGEANNIEKATIRHWIDSGADLEKVGDDLLGILEQRGKSANAPALIGMDNREVRKYSILKAIRAAKANDWSKAGLEFEAHRYLMDRDNLQPHSSGSVYVPLDVQTRAPRYGSRDFTAATAGAAGGVGTEHLSSSFIDLLYNQSVTMSSGATRLTGLRGNVQIPKLTAGSTSYWLANETTAITESTPTMGKVSLSPKNVAALVEVSHQMAQQSDPSAEQMILNDLATSVALAMDLGALSGDGTGGAPTGIINTSGIGAFTGTSLDYAAVLNAQEDVVAANAMGVGGLGYVCDPATTVKLMTRVKFSGTASPIWDGNILLGDCAGLPGRTSNQMAANTALFGAWASLIIAEWGTLELAVDDKFNFATGSMGLRAWYTVDVGVRYPAAFSYSSSIT